MSGRTSVSHFGLKCLSNRLLGRSRLYSPMMSLVTVAANQRWERSVTWSITFIVVVWTVIVRSDPIHVDAVLCVSGLFCIRSVSPIDVLTAAVGADLRLDGGFNIYQLCLHWFLPVSHWQCSETSLSSPFVCLRRHSDKTENKKFSSNFSRIISVSCVVLIALMFVQLVIFPSESTALVAIMERNITSDSWTLLTLLNLYEPKLDTVAVIHQRNWSLVPLYLMLNTKQNMFLVIKWLYGVTASTG